jgi:L-iditol 2-dehydrogenase
MAETMKAAVLHGIRDLRIDDVAKPVIVDPGDVLIRVTAVGICGSDIHFWERMHVGDFIVEKPMTLGHESAGEVVEVGPAVTGLAVGDVVAIEPGRPCRRCELCRTGHYNQCHDMIFMACPPYDGAFSEYVVWPSDYCFKMPSNMSAEEGAMMEPLSVGMHAVRKAGTRAGDTVAVFGTGPIGLVTLQSAKAHGATRIFAVDVVDARLKWAASLGATDVINGAGQDAVAVIKEATGGRGVDATFECAGAIPTMHQAMQACRNGGMVQLVGNQTDMMPPVPFFEIMNRELTVKGTFRYVNVYPAAISVTAAGLVDVRALITHHYTLEELPEAIAWVHENKDKVVKAVVRP